MKRIDVIEFLENENEEIKNHMKDVKQTIPQLVNVGESIIRVINYLNWLNLKKKGKSNGKQAGIN